MHYILNLQLYYSLLSSKNNQIYAWYGLQSNIICKDMNIVNEHLTIEFDSSSCHLFFSYH